MKARWSLRRTSALGQGLVLIAMLCTIAPAAAEPPDVSTTEQVRAYVQPSVVSITIEWTGYVYDDASDRYVRNEPFSRQFQCSGFAVGPDGHLVTGSHCVVFSKPIAESLKTDAARWALNNVDFLKKQSPGRLTRDYRVLNVDGKDDIVPSAFAVWGVTSGGVESGRRYPARIVEVQGADTSGAALLKVDAQGLQTLDLATGEPDIGQRVVSAGNSGFTERAAGASFAATLTAGTIDAMEPQDAGGVLYDISAELPSGMDGGPTVDLKHRVVGFNSPRFDPETETSAYDYVRSTSRITELMGAAAVDNGQSTVGRDYQSGLDAYFEGDKDAAIEAFRKVLAAQPGNTMAKAYLARAEKLPASGGWLSATFGLILAGLVALAGAVLVKRTVQSRRGRESETGRPSAAAENEPETSTSGTTDDMAGRIYISHRHTATEPESKTSEP